MAHPSLDTRLRSSCDRCHELKNRCARTGDLDSRCERCDRLDIDCVYGRSVRMGRPPGQKGNSNKDGDRQDNRAQPRPPKRQARAWVRDSQPPLRSPTTPSSGVGVDRLVTPCSSSSSSQRIATQAPSAATTTSSSVTDTEQLPSPSDMISPTDFEPNFWLDAEAADFPLNYRGRAGRKTSVIDDRLPRADSTASFDLSPDEHSVFDFHAQATTSLFSNGFGGLAATSLNSAILGPNIINSSTTSKRFNMIVARLLNLQNHLRDIVAANHDGCFGSTTGDETVLTAAKDLWDITQSFLELGSPQSPDRSAKPFGTGGASSSSSESFRFAYPAFKYTDTATCHSTILQLVTCYAYLIQVLESVVPRLAGAIQGQGTSLPLGSPKIPTPSSLTGLSSTGPTSSYSNPSHDSAFVDHLHRGYGSSSGPGASTTGFSLGRFSLAAESTLNAEMVLHVLFRMVQKTHTNIDRLSFEKDTASGETKEQSLATALLDTPECSPIMMSARAVMAVVYSKETHLIQRMKELL